MAPASTRSLVLLSAIFWYVGGFVLLVKGGSLVAEACRLKADLRLPVLVCVLGLSFGLLKARFIFTRSCRKNLARIRALQQPRWWQFFGPGFFVLLGLMILLGAALSRMSQGSYLFLLGVALLDFSVAVALLVSSGAFWG